MNPSLWQGDCQAGHLLLIAIVLPSQGKWHRIPLIVWEKGLSLQKTKVYLQQLLADPALRGSVDLPWTI